MKYILLSVLILAGLLTLSASRAQAACPKLPTTLGQTSVDVTIPTDGIYVLWSKIMIPDATNSSYYLQVDDSSCDIIVNGSNAPINTWTWVNGLGGTTSNKVILNLKAGKHTFVLTGKESGVKVDELLLLADDSCVPTGLGENCIAPAKNDTDTDLPLFICLGGCPTSTSTASLSTDNPASNQNPITTPSNDADQADFIMLLRNFLRNFFVGSPSN